MSVVKRFTHRLRVGGFFDGALAIHGGDTPSSSDMVLARDPMGMPFVAGSSLAGALRGSLATLRGEAEANRVFGWIEDSDDALSSVVVYDAEYVGPSVEPEVRWHVAIDRRRLAALDGALFTEEVWPHRLPFRLRFDLDDPGLIEPLLVALAGIGAHGSGIGSGPTPFVTTQVETIALPDGGFTDRALAFGKTISWDDCVGPDDLDLDHDAPGGIVDLSDSTTARLGESGLVLAGDGAWSGEDGLVSLTVNLTLRLVEPLRSGAPVPRLLQQRGSPDYRILLIGRVDGDRMQAPRLGLDGRGLHGVLRQRCERRLAFLNGSAAADDPRAVSDGPIADMFGWAPVDRTVLGRAGSVHVADLIASGDTIPETRTRVSIDRLTGGAYPQRLWTEEVLPPGTKLTTRVTLRRPDLSPVPGLYIGLLAGALSDLVEGRCGIGSATHSGYGTLEVAESTVTVLRRRGGGFRTAEETSQDSVAWHEDLREEAVAGLDAVADGGSGR